MGSESLPMLRLIHFLNKKKTQRQKEASNSAQKRFCEGLESLKFFSQHIRIQVLSVFQKFFELIEPKNQPYNQPHKQPNDQTAESDFLDYLKLFVE